MRDTLFAQRLRGAAALVEMLALIGNTSASDTDAGRLLTENEMELRELLSFALAQLRQDLRA